MSNFKKGLFFGGLLGAGLVWLNVTKKGKELREKILDYATDVYSDVKEKVLASESWDRMSKSKYYALVQEAVEKYAGEKGLAENVKNMIQKIVSKQWYNLERELKKRK